MKIWTILSLLPLLAFGQINVGPAINNLNSRVTALENRPVITTGDILAMGFLTNELDTIALGALGVYTNSHNLVHSNLNDFVSSVEGYTNAHNSVHSNLNLWVASVEGKADFPVRVYNQASNAYLEISGNTVQLYTNGIFFSQMATTNDLIPILDLITNNFTYLNDRVSGIEIGVSNLAETVSGLNVVDSAFRLINSSTNLFIKIEGTNAVLYGISGSTTNAIKTFASKEELESAILDFNVSISNNMARFVRPFGTVLSVYSNSLYLASSEPDGITFLNPESYPDKESRLTIHLYKGSSAVTWFPNITWVYGAEPEWQETNKTYVIQFESINGTNWRGWIEYVY